MTEHFMPHNLEIEKALLATILMSPSKLPSITQKLDKESFYSGVNSECFQLYVDMFKDDVPIEAQTMLSYIKEKVDMFDEPLYKFVNKSTISELLTTEYSIASTNYYITKLRELHKRRAVIEATIEMSEQAGAESIDIDDIASKAISKISNALDVESGVQTFGEAIDKFDEEMREFKESGRKYRGAESGIGELDEYLSGIRKGHLGVITAYTSTGKTSFALNIMAEFIKRGEKVVFFSLEMDGVEIIGRMLSILSGVHTTRIEHDNLNRSERQAVQEVKDMLRQNGSLMYTSNDWNSIQLNMMRESAKGDTHLFIFDYFQLIKIPGMSDYESYSTTAKVIQRTMKRYRIPMIALSQISNATAKDDKSGFIDTKGAGDIAASADWIVRLKNAESDEETIEQLKREEKPLEIQIKLQKNRHGRTGTFSRYLDTTCQRFISQDENKEKYGYVDQQYSNELEKFSTGF